jgi:D-beta-D-heptose 7-phosphate kinase/D-beta-D-heptose 1-phosphate adenosyltransferase
MNAKLFDITHRFADLRVLVVGEAMLDSYLDGYTDRVSREAPVPVVSVTERRDAAGGAANTAVNVRTLGGEVAFVSVCGDDEDSARLREVLEAQGVPTDHMIVHPQRRTLAKRRVAASGQMLVRFDQGDADLIDAETEDEIIRRVTMLFPMCDALIISDYGYGVLTPRILQTVKDLQAWARHAGTPRVIAADAKYLAGYREIGVTAVKPNYGEAVRLLGLPKLEGACARAEQITPYAEQMLDITGAQVAAITLDTEGALVCERGNAPYRTYARPEPDSRAAGAGDTFISALTLALAAGTDTPNAAEIASAAARVVVSKPGTTACSASELQEYFLGGDKLFFDPHRLAARLDVERQGCRRIVFTNGVFDILHRGHVTYLNQAKALGHVLVVGLNTDESVRRLKGPTRPINGLEDRLQVLAGVSSVDYVIPFGENTPAELLSILRPDVFVKGGDYTRETLPEARVVEEYGGVVQVLPYVENRSTTYMIQRIREVYATPLEAVALAGVNGR